MQQNRVYLTVFCYYTPVLSSKTASIRNISKSVITYLAFNFLFKSTFLLFYLVFYLFYNFRKKLLISAIHFRVFWAKYPVFQLIYTYLLIEKSVIVRNSNIPFAKSSPHVFSGTKAIPRCHSLSEKHYYRDRQ